MKKVILFFVCIFSVSMVQAQINAVTETGEEVVLFQDGSWIYKNTSVVAATQISTNSKTFSKPETSSFLLKSTNINVGVWIDTKAWTFKKSTENEAAEYKFQSKAGDLYGMLLTEKIEIPLESLKEIALKNAKAASPDIEIIKEEYRIVNNVKVLMLQMNGTINGIKFTYLGYYYSSEAGTVQFITYTSQNLFKSYQPKCEELLNGFVVIK